MKNNKISFVLSISSAFFLIFSFPPFNLWLLAWFALIPLLLILEKSTPREVFLFYFLSGLGFWLYHIWWLTYVTFLGYSLLVIYLASLLGFFGLLLKFLKEKTQYPLLFLAPSLWVLFEFIRMYLLTGFPWSLLGYSQWRNIPLIQISSITGVYGVSFLIVMVNAAISDFAFSKTKKQLRNLLLAILTIVSIVVVGEEIVLKGKEDESRKMKISVIQGNIPQDVKWDEKYEKEILDIYTGLSIEAKKSTSPSLIIWPETSYPEYVYEGGESFGKIVELTYDIKTPLLIGGLNYIDDKDYNSAFLILPEEGIKQTLNQSKLGSGQVYNKLHLVPFGEYIPLKKIFFFLSNTTPQIGSFNKGKEYTIFEISDGVRYSVSSESSDRNPKSEIRNRFAVLICFEDLFPDLARRFTEEGAEFLVNITNDAHFHESPGLWQHFTHSVFRAVENRRPVVRASNNGISGFIDSYGRTVQILNEDGKAMGVRGWATNLVSCSSAKTFYTRFGDLFVYLNIFYLGIVLMITAKKNIKKL